MSVYSSTRLLHSGPVMSDWEEDCPPPVADVSSQFEPARETGGER